MISNNIIQGFPTPQKDYYKVYVHSITYNQASYIEDCLNGVAMQQTDFPFLHHVVDDCSTDGEQEVIKAWIERECELETAEYYDNDICTITLTRNKSNPNCTLAVYFLKRNMYREGERKNKLYTPWREVCPYEAICEGDDYWTDALKLEKQTDVMECNPNCTLCYHSCKNIFEGEGIVCDYPICETVDNSYNTIDILSGYPFQTATVLIRTSIFCSNVYNKIGSKNLTSSFYFLIAAEQGNLIGINKQMSVYRRCMTGISNSQNNEIQFKYCKKLIDSGRYFSKKTCKMIHKIAVRRIESSLLFKNKRCFFKVLIYEISKQPILGILNLLYIVKMLFGKFRSKYIKKVASLYILL